MPEQMPEQSGNGQAPITKEALADRSRFQFKTEELDLSDWITGVKLELRTLSVAQRDGLPDLVDKDGNGIVTIPKLAAIFSAVVAEPKVTVEEAQEFLGDWPADALDQVIERFTALSGETKEEQSAAASSFPAAE